jgi:amino acid adenylation domain-containing protein
MKNTYRTLEDPNFGNSRRADLPEPMKRWGGSLTPYPREKSVVALFEEVAATHADNVAVVSKDRRLTYAELNAQANQLARQLKGMKVVSETLVGCCIERSIEYVVAILAVLKAGGAYVPLDPSYPKERLDFLLEDTRTPLITTQKRLASTVLSGRNVPLFILDASESVAFSTDAANLSPTAGPTNLAYVMYTSGSTGRPKGVMVEHRGIVRLVRDTNYCRFGPDEVFLQFAPASFDASTFEIWGPLLSGGRLIIPPPQASSLEDLGRIIRENGVTTLWLTAGLFHLMVDQRVEDLRPLRQLLAGGDVLSAEHVRRFLKNVPTCSLINGYGPTENTTFTCCHVMHAGDSIADSVPIGRPVSNTQVYILDEHLRPVGPGVAGELYAGGDGLARGYLNDREATAASFVRNPFSDNRAERIYRTGDLARWRDDGVIEFLGRVDNQVKILGYRIEPNEIEAALGKHHGVAQVCVVAQNDQNDAKRLVAFFVPSEYSPANAQQLRNFAAEKLPHYMMPAQFVALSSLPLSPNGKIDRAALAQIHAVNSGSGSPMDAPETRLERALTELWSRVLRVGSVGLDDNFFDLGGDSLQLVAVHSHLQKTLQIDIPVTDLFEFTTIRKLARHIEDRSSAGASLVAAQQQAQRQSQAFAQFRGSRSGGNT